MSVRNLEYLFQPKSVAVVGASIRPMSVGGAVLRNVREGGFAGAVLPVNPKYREIEGARCWHDVTDLPQAPDLAVLCTPPRTIPGLVDTLGRRGTRGIAILTAGLDSVPEGAQRTLAEEALTNAGRHGVRLLGPNCLGLIVPGIGLNASFAPGMVRPGKLAFVSQSGALATAVADWARTRRIGFTHFASLGNSLDVDFGDVLDYLGGDSATRAILLYIESVKHARKFMSAARAAARNKPVVVVKAGRNEAGARAAASHTGALAGSDLVYDAAIRRAGMLRVATTEELFDAVETLARGQPVRGDRLLIVTNGGGPGVMAVDALPAEVQLAELAEATRQRLAQFLPPTWSQGNPVDLIGDAPPERYRDALTALLADPGIDALAFVHAPTAIVPAEAIAEAVVPLLSSARMPVYACWMGGAAVKGARARFEQAGIPCFESPEDAVRAFGHMVRYHRNQEQLIETPPAAADGKRPDTARARQVIDATLGAGRELLTEAEAKTVLAAYGVPVVETRIARDAGEAIEAARELGFPAALKILSPDISHKSDVGGVALNLEGEDELRAAAMAMLERVRGLRPDARIEGFTVQRMIHRPQAVELIAGIGDDAVFGPIILFGHGGTAVEVIADRAIALPPLNPPLAADLVARTRVARLLRGYRDRPPADHSAICRTLVQLSELAIGLPEVAELDINPLLADAQGVIALDARIRVARRAPDAGNRLAIMPYPGELQEERIFDGQPLWLRPIRPEDEPAHAEFLRSLKAEDVRFRFFGLVRQFAHSELARYTQIDYDREMAFIATATGADGRPCTLGVVRAVIAPDRTRAEFAIVVRSELKGRGLGYLLLDKMIRYCRARGIAALFGQTLAGNRDMQALAKRLGFALEAPQDGVVNLVLNLG